MRRAERIARIEHGLQDAANICRVKGIHIIYDAAEEYDGDRLVGCCVTAARDNCVDNPAALPSLPFSSRWISEEFEAIESGFDGARYSSKPQNSKGPIPRDFWAMGRRLRNLLRPVTPDYAQEFPLVAP